jgi:hypothetical protein
MDGVVERDILGTHFRINDLPVFASAHLEMLALTDLQYLHFTHNPLL